MEIFFLSFPEALPRFEFLFQLIFESDFRIFFYFAPLEIESLFSSKGLLRHVFDRGMRTGTQLVFLLLWLTHRG